MVKKNISDFRGTLAYLKDEGEVLTVEKEVDPIYEVSGIMKAFDGGIGLHFTNIKGYPNNSIIGNIFSRRERIAKIFGVEDPKKLKLKYLEAVKNHIKPILVENPPCQENIVTKDIDMQKMLPLPKITEEDGGRMLGGGNTLIAGDNKGSHLSFNRANFRGKDWGSYSINITTHVEYHALEARKTKGKLPITNNICASPAIWAAAGGGIIPLTMPPGSDELAIAGGIQGSPIEICKAKTIDTYALANAEWVIEGYIDTSQVVYETDEAERLGKINQGNFFPEYTGYMGKAYKTYKFQVTGVTYRNNPIFFAPLAHSIEGNNITSILREASFYDILNRTVPGLVIDVNILDALKGFGGLVIQVHKRRRRDEGYQRNLINTAFASSFGLRMVVVVDEDVDIYNADDVMWAISTRVDPTRDIIVHERIKGSANFPTEKTEEGEGEGEGMGSAMGFDATIPYWLKSRFAVGKHPKVDLSRWFTPEEISHARSLQSEFG
ncbi:MAG: UbiD family decarboxylase, partial [Thermodesulfobacteriota bacterium]|nr:UbiD family decarboxylase [Thermodesulfobacteriota bacterium]